jgi:hypothetical protein
MRIFMALLLLLAPCTAGAGEGHGGGQTRHKTGSFFMVTAGKHFSIEMELEGNALKEGENKAEIVIHDRNDKDVKGAAITLTPWMPGMGHGVPEVPVVREEEGFFGSRYHVANLMISMGGHWEILVEVEKNGVKDGAVFDFADVGGKGMKQGKMKMKAPADLDLATTMLSDKKIFSVSYTSDPPSPPTNKIHTWSLAVTTPSGEPVTGAMVMVSGDMPEHGHGLPTEPEVTDEVAPGVYLVEGMKFSMPGWWVVSFHVKSGSREDSVTFNLRLK